MYNINLPAKIQKTIVLAIWIISVTWKSDRGPACVASAPLAVRHVTKSARSAMRPSVTRALRRQGASSSGTRMGNAEAGPL